jgi:mRNA interferase RelE/StbE
MRKLDSQTRKRLCDFLETRIANLDDPRQQGSALTGTLGGLWRYRVGDHRIICEIQDFRIVILVLRIGHRREIYRD